MISTTRKNKPVILAAAMAVIAGVAGVAVVAANGDDAAAREPAAEMLTAHGLDGLDARQIVDTLDAQPLDERPTDLIASIRPDELLLSDSQGNETSLPMPADEFYMSFAPYVDATHPCHFHSLTTCTGELRNAELAVTIVDNTTGEVLVDETMRAFDNGFVGVWLPRGLDVTLTVEHDGLTGTDTFTTTQPDDGTCLTTIQLTEA